MDWSVPTTHALGLVEGLIQRGHEVQMVCRGGVFLPRFQSLGVEVYQDPGSWLARRRMTTFLHGFQPTVIHAVGGHGSLRIANRLSVLLGRPFVHTVHSWLRAERTARSTRSAAGVIVVNQDLRQHMVSELGIKKELIRVIPYGIDVLETDPLPWVPRKIPVIGTVGRLEKGRRLDDFLNAASLLRQKLGEVIFTVLGEGPDEGRLRSVCKSMDLEGHLTFAAPPADVDAVYRAFDVLMLVSDWGGAGVHLLEGLARGVPTIATGGGEILSLLGEEGVCTLVRPRDPEALAQAGARLLADPERAKKQAEKGVEYVRNTYPMRVMLDRVEELHESLRQAITA
ncbi:MAG: glycosyltransferase family 4 protein [Planctomycetota bacterium]|nr:glycosyltransferase family 4 protein [Planctomycetota bacterium]